MKKFIVAALAFSSVSAFADCSLMVRFVDESIIDTITSEIRNTHVVRYAEFSRQNADLGVKQVKRVINTGVLNPFGTAVYNFRQGFEIYKEGKLISAVESEQTKLAVEKLLAELKDLGCN